MGFIDEIKARAKACKKTIVLPETEDERTYKAAETVLKEGLADLVLVGSKEEIEKNKGTYDISGATIVFCIQVILCAFSNTIRTL